MPYQQIKFYQAGSFVAGNRLLDPEQRTVQADPERANALTSGHRACQGCGEALGARYAIDAALRAADGKVIATNSTGCLEVFTTPFPESAWQLPWIHSLFGNAPAVATGVAAALKAKGRDDIRVIGQGGDGGTVDIGFACLSGMFERNDDVRDLEYKVEHAMKIRGSRYLHILVTCPLGWGCASGDSIKVARLAKESGLFPVFEAEYGEVTSSQKIRRRVPVEEYLKLQRRYAHLFGKQPRRDIIDALQARADRYIERFGLLDEETVDEPSALSLQESERVHRTLDEETNATRLLTEKHKEI
jgi:pyruvate/2-oxoacid:ferredoxin oxidoreductase beta subunit